MNTPRNVEWAPVRSAGEEKLRMILPSWVGWIDKSNRLTKLHITASGWTTLCGVRIGWWSREGIEFAVDIDYFGPHARSNNICKRCYESSGRVIESLPEWFSE